MLPAKLQEQLMLCAIMGLQSGWICYIIGIMKNGREVCVMDEWNILQQADSCMHTETGMITLSKADYESMLQYALHERPEEVCGLLGGVTEGTDKHIKRVYLLTNCDHSSKHFSIDPREQFAAVRDMRANGWEPLGCWHSHPQSPAIPSEEDVRLAYDSRASYLILSCMEEAAPMLHAFHIADGMAEQEKLVIV